MKVTNWIYFVLAFAVTVALAIIFSGVGFMPFTDIPSFLIVIPGAYFLTLFSHGPRGLARAYRAASSSRSNRADCLYAVEVFRGLQHSFILTGCLGTLMGTIAMINFPQVSAQNVNYVTGAATAVLTILYSIVAMLFLAIPFKAAAAARAAELS